MTQEIQQKAWEIAANVLDPEIPIVTVEDLGILREIYVKKNGTVVAKVSPTYMGCPAVSVIEETIQKELENAGYKTQIERVLNPAWNTNWITQKGRQKLKEFGIAPPVGDSGGKRILFEDANVKCPKCDADETSKISEFGSTPCKAQYKCNICKEPFDYFKCI